MATHRLSSLCMYSRKYTANSAQTLGKKQKVNFNSPYSPLFSLLPLPCLGCHFESILWVTTSQAVEDQCPKWLTIHIPILQTQTHALKHMYQLLMISVTYFYISCKWSLCGCLMPKFRSIFDSLLSEDSFLNNHAENTSFRPITKLKSSSFAIKKILTLVSKQHVHKQEKEMCTHDPKQSRQQSSCSIHHCIRKS